MRRQIKLFMVMVVFLGLVACAGFTKNTYRGIFLAGTSYDAAMKSVADLQSKGKITLAQRAEINKVANVYYVAYQVSVDALYFYEQTKTQVAKDKIIFAIATMVSKWSELAGYINRIVPGILPEKLEGL